MSDPGEKTCPLCAEEMDLTDQQLKPCKCGYEICVWCWHHIMNMAEKDNVEGRCPACRTPYNKEKIVEKAAQCERLVSGLSVEKKVKSKSKGKTADGRKNLSGVRVIQRNLVYIVGLPVNLADEDLLQRKEYFAQYGKVQKVSISRTAAGTIQQFPNSTCSVYITYSKEEEAVRCIQSVHGYTLEGRPLRACFGTTKYCHAWLRSVPCSNPECLYLHEIGTPEDSFTKDEIISGYTRNRVQQSTGATVNMQNRSGNVLPPPADEFGNSNFPSSGVHNNISSTNNLAIGSDSILDSSVWQTPASSVRGSPPNNSSNKSVGLPAAASWGMRVSNQQQSQASMINPNGPNQKADACGISVAFSTAVASPAKVSILLSDSGKKLNEESAFQRNNSEVLDGDQKRMPLHTSAMTGHSVELVVSKEISMPSLKVDASMSMPADVVQSADFTKQSCGIRSESNPHVPIESEIQKICSNISSLNIDTQGLQCGDTLYKEHLSSLTDIEVPSSTKDLVAQRDQSILKFESQFQVAESDKWKVKDNMQSLDIKRLRDPEVVSHIDNLPKLAHASNSSRIVYPQEVLHLSNVNVHSTTRDKEPNKFSVPLPYNVPVISDGYVGNQARSFTNLDRVNVHPTTRDKELNEYNVPVISDGYFGNRTRSFTDLDRVYVHPTTRDKELNEYNVPVISDNYFGNHARSFTDLDGYLDRVNVHSTTRDKDPNEYNVPVISDGYVGNRARSFADLDRSANDFSYLVSDEVKNMHVGSYNSQLVDHDGSSADHLGESSIISNILSMDFDSWDESLVSPQNLANLLGETDKQQGSQGVSGSTKVQNSNQSRFSFAREEDQASKFGPSFTGFEQTLRNRSFTNGSRENENYYDGAIGGGFSTFSARQHGDYTSNRFPVSRAPVSAPPGFSVPSKAPPPGFGSYEKMEQMFDINSGNRLVENLSFLRNTNQSPSTMHIDSTHADIEFIDPAILAVGKGRLAAGLDSSVSDIRSTYPTQMNNYESEARLQLLLQKYHSQQQNPRYFQMGDNSPSRPDNYGMPSRILEQAIANNASQYPQFGIPHSRNQLMSSGNWDGWSEVQSGNNLNAVELLRSERLGIEKYFTGHKDSKYRIPSSGNLYN